MMLSCWLVLLALLLPGVSTATLRLVNGSTGSNHPGCTGTPCATVKYCITQMASGDICEVASGTYIEGGNYSLPSGSAGAPSILRAASGATVTLRPNDHDNVAWLLPNNTSYVTFDHIILDGSSDGSSASGSRTTLHGVAVASDPAVNVHHITFSNGEIKNFRGNGMLTAGTQWTVTKNLIHENGGGFGVGQHQDTHGLYFSSDNSTISYNTLWGNDCWQIQNFGPHGGMTGFADPSNNVYDGNIFQDGGPNAGTCGGFTITNGSNILVKNTVMYDSGSYGIQAFVPDTKVINNTLHNSAIATRSSDGPVYIYNNLLCASSIAFVAPSGEAADNTTTCTGFVNLGVHNYRITTSSPGYNSAVEHASASLALVPLDADQNARPFPAGGAYDKGAYEYGSSTEAPVATALRFLVQPSNVTINAAMTPAVQVEVIDQFGAHITTSTTVALTLSAGGTLSGGGSTATVSGTATFSSLTVNAAGTYTLTATASGLTSATSTSFVVSNPSSACTSPCTVFVSASAADDSQPCVSADITHPRKTTAGGVACMTVPGSTLYFRTGTYDPIDTAVQALAGGSSWATATTVAAYGSDVVTLQVPVGGQSALSLTNTSTDHFLIFDRLTFDAANRSGSNAIVFTNVHDIRVQNSDVKNSFYERVYVRESARIEIRTSRIHTTGQLGAVHVVGASDGFLFTGNEVDTANETGLRIVGTDSPTGVIFNSTITANVFHGLGATANVPAVVVGGSGSTGLLVANNVFYSNYAGLQLLAGSDGAKVYNNTIYGSTTFGVQLETGSTGVLYTNNISTNNATNLTNSAGATVTTSLTTNPGFVSPATGDFRLTASATAAFDQGTTLATEVPTDNRGIARPQTITTATYDIGASECVPAECAATPPPSGGVQLMAPMWQTQGFLRR